MSGISGKAWRQATFTVFKKEMRTELRSRVSISGIALFAFSALILLTLATATLREAQTIAFSKMLDGMTVEAIAKLRYPAWDWVSKMGLLWILLFFAAFTGLAHTFVQEEEAGTTLVLRMVSPPTAVYAGKLLFNFMLLLAVMVGVTPVYMALTGMVIGSPFVLLSVMLGGCLGLSATATIVAALAAKAKGSGTLFSALGLPLVTVFLLLLLNAASTANTIDPSALRLLRDVGGLYSFAIGVIALSGMLFPYIWEE
ncbi:MAG: heme exporter protein CcmB [Chthonomonadaceae bacterium]|nr:heme exporter protein CcmB [Chthonomonadaceae bacterium]